MGNDESRTKGTAPESATTALDPISFRYAAMSETACRDEWDNAKLCAKDAYNAGLAVGYQKRVDEECAAALPLALYVTGNKSKTGLSDRVLHDMFTGAVA